MKPPEIPDIDVTIVDKALTVWKAGGLVAMPTETVYGLAADATDGAAVARIYQLKDRPQFNPLIVHVADIATAERYGEWTELADALAADYWPGPLTLVLKRRVDCPASELVSAGGDTIALRCPAHPVAHRLLSAWGGGLAAPSANHSGRVSPTTAQHVRDEFGDAVLVIDGGPCQHGIESTVLDLSGEVPTILRPGSITLPMIQYVVRGLDPQASVAIAGAGSAIRSPGQLASHYAPSIPVRVNATSVGPQEALLAFGPSPLAGAAAMRNLSARGDLVEAASQLFAHLRALDDPSHSAIAVMPIPAEGIGEAINDRLRRASA